MLGVADFTSSGLGSSLRYRLIPGHDLGAVNIQLPRMCNPYSVDSLCIVNEYNCCELAGLSAHSQFQSQGTKTHIDASL